MSELYSASQAAFDYQKSLASTAAKDKAEAARILTLVKRAVEAGQTYYVVDSSLSEGVKHILRGLGFKVAQESFLNETNTEISGWV